jgi:hypothetical protein
MVLKGTKTPLFSPASVPCYGQKGERQAEQQQNQHTGKGTVESVEELLKPPELATLAIPGQLVSAAVSAHVRNCAKENEKCG